LEHNKIVGNKIKAVTKRKVGKTFSISVYSRGPYILSGLALWKVSWLWVCTISTHADSYSFGRETFLITNWQESRLIPML